MLKGFRFCRLALGLYFRGLDQERQHMIERWPTQLAELYEMQQGAGIDGFEAEYWRCVSLVYICYVCRNVCVPG